MTSFSRILLSTIVAFSLCTSIALADESALQKTDAASLKSILARLGSDLYAYTCTHEGSVVTAVATTAIAVGAGMLIVIGPSSSKQAYGKGYKEGYAKHQSELNSADVGISVNDKKLTYQDLNGKTHAEKLTTLRQKSFDAGCQMTNEKWVSEMDKARQKH